MQSRAQPRIAVRIATVALSTVALALAGCGSSQSSQSTSASTQTQAQPPTSTTSPATNPTPTLMPCPVAVSIPSQTKCDLNGSTVQIARGTQPLALKTLVVHLVSTRTTPSVSNGEGFTSTAKGVYLVITLKVTNNSGSPQSFGRAGAPQTALEISGNTYSEAFDAENENDGQSFLTQNATTPIQTGESETGDVIFDVPPGQAIAATKNVNSGLVVGNFGDDLSQSFPDALGFVSLAGVS